MKGRHVRKRTLKQVLTGRGTDGLTKKEREALARKHGLRHLSEEDVNNVIVWRERRQ